MKKDILTIKDTQEFLGIGRCSALDLFNKADFPGFKLCRKWYVKYDDLMDYLEQIKEVQSVQCNTRI